MLTRCKSVTGRSPISRVIASAVRRFSAGAPTASASSAPEGTAVLGGAPGPAHADGVRACILILALLTACVDGPGADALGPGQSSGGRSECLTVACPLGDEVFCGEPVVRVGTGNTRFEPIEDGTVTLAFSTVQSACAYHFFLALETENLCPIIDLEYDVHLLGIDGGPIVSGGTATQFVRRSGTSNVQEIWDIPVRLPTAYYPNDREHSDVCPGDQELACDESQFLIQVRVADRAGGFATAESLLDPVCCAD